MENIAAKKNIKLPALLTAASLFFILLYAPVFNNEISNRALALLVFVAVLWMTEAIPLALTALSIPAIAILLGLLPPANAFSQFANPVIFLFMGGFVLAGALSAQSLDKLLAQKLIGLAKGNFYRSSILLMLTTSLLACWISNTSSAAMMIPLALGLLRLANQKDMARESKFLMLGIAYSANIGGVITMIASPPNAIGAAILGMSFSEWMAYGLPIFLITFPTMIMILTLYFRPDRKLTIEKLIIKDLKTPYRKRLVIIFFLTVFLWMSDGLLSPLLNITSGFSSLVAIFSILLLFIFKVMEWDDILSSIKWDILLLFGGGLTLGVLVESSGLGAILIAGVMEFGKEIPLFLFLWLIVLFSIALTEFMSNTASAALILPLLYTLAVQSNINPMILVLPATIATSYGFMLPVGTPPNAMVFSTGFIPQTEMMKVGFAINIIFSIILTLFFYLLF
ncbi:MAG TPA: DASS family sodium-coupled anion symporter [Flavobacterium sp.]